MEDIQIKVSPASIQSFIDLRNQMKEFRADLSTATDPERVIKLAQEMGKVKDQLKDANEQVKIFSAGSDFEKASNALGLIKNDLASMDFEGAAAKAKTLNKIVSGISFETATKGLKDLGSALAGIGKSLLGNPLFLMGAAIAAVGIAVIALLDHLGVFKAIMETLNDIGAAFVDTLDDITDALGWTTIATDKANEALALRLKLADEVDKIKLENEIKNTEKLIALYEKQGKNTTELTKSLIEAKKSLTLLNVSMESSPIEKNIKDWLKIQEIFSDIEKTTKKLDETDFPLFSVEKSGLQKHLGNLKDQLKDYQKAFNKSFKEAYGEEYENSVIQNEKITGAQLKQQEKNKQYAREYNLEKAFIEQAAADKAAAAIKRETDRIQRIQDEADRIKKALLKAYNAEELKLTREKEDQLTNLKEEGEAKDLEILHAKYRRSIEDINRSEYNENQKANLVKIVKEQELIDEGALTEKYNKIKLENEKLYFTEKALYADNLATWLKDNEQNVMQSYKDAQAQDLADYNVYLNERVQSKIYSEEQAQALFNSFIKKQTFDRNQFEEQDNMTNYQKRLTNENQLHTTKLSTQLANLTELKNLELLMAEQTGADKALIEQKYADEAKALRKKQRDEENQAIQGSLQTASNGINAIMELNNSLYEAKSKNLKKGSAEEIAAAKKNFETNKKLQVAQAVIQGIQATLAAFSSGSAIPIVGAVTGPIFAAAAAIASAANVMKIKNTSFESPAVSTSSSSSATQSPLFNFYGSGTKHDEQAAKNGRREMNPNAQNITVTAVISETEISSTQDRMASLKANAKLGR